MTTTDEARVTDEEIAEALANPSFWEIVGPCWCINGDTCRHWPHVRLEDVERVIAALADRLAARDAEVEFYKDSLEAAHRNAKDSIDARDAELAKLQSTLEMREDQITELVSTNAIETSRLRSERVEMVALLDEPRITMCASGFHRNGDKCEWFGGDCWGCRRMALLAKLRTP